MPNNQAKLKQQALLGHKLVLLVKVQQIRSRRE
jgi:hypothetical protein